MEKNVESMIEAVKDNVIEKEKNRYAFSMKIFWESYGLKDKACSLFIAFSSVSAIIAIKGHIHKEEFQKLTEVLNRTYSVKINSEESSDAHRMARDLEKQVINKLKSLEINKEN